MFLQTNLTTRRQFLERSAWGFGSAFLLPSLLASCTDHRIDPTNPLAPPAVPPILSDTGVDWNDDAKIVVVAGLEELPGVGMILGPLVDIFWPNSKQDVWAEMRAQVEALVNQKIADNVYQIVSEDLKGLQKVMQNYLYELHDGTPNEILTQWIAAKDAFDLSLPHFQSTGYEVLLLPLFGQVANMYLSLLRDPLVILRDANHNPILDTDGKFLLAGKSWNRTDADQQRTAADLTATIQDFTTYTTTTYTTGRANVVKNTKANNDVCEPFLTVNRYDRQMTLTALDFRDTWPYYDTSQYPNGKPDLILTREIYSDPMGSCHDSGNIVIATPPPTQLPSRITVWGYDRIDAVQVDYPAGGGPGGITQTPRMGDQPDGHGSGGTNQPPHGGIFTPSPDNPITRFRVVMGKYKFGSDYLRGPLVSAMQFQYYNGTPTNLMGGTVGAYEIVDLGLYGYSHEALSSVHINGINKVIGSADCVVFGFKQWNPPSATLRAIRIIYVTSPNEHTVADFVKAFPKLGIPADLITDELKAYRKAYWAYMKAAAKGPK